MTLIGKQRIVIGMYDGLGMDYMEASPLPAFSLHGRAWFFQTGERGFPDGHQCQQRVDLLRHMAQRAWHHRQLLFQRAAPAKPITWRTPILSASRRSFSAPPSAA